MSTTPEQMRRELEEFKAQAQMRKELAAFKASQVGTQSMGAPAPDERTLMERVRGAAASIAEPWVETAQGLEELLGTADPETVEQYRAVRGELTRQAEAVPGRTAGRVLGETAMLLAPGSAAYRAGQAMRGLPGVRSRLAQGAAPLTTETAAVAGTEALKTPEATGMTRGEAARNVALANVAGAGLQRAVRGAALPGAFRRTPQAEAEAQALRAAGIEPRIPLSAKGVEGTGPFSKFASWMHRRPLGSVPPTQSVIRGQQEAALGDWRDMVFMRTVPQRANIQTPGARTGSLDPVRDTFKDINKWYKDEYKQVLDPYTFDVQGPQSTVGAAIDNAIASVPGEVSRRTVQDKVSDLLADMTDSAGRLTGGKVSQLKNSLRRQSTRVDVDPEVAAGYSGIIEALDDSVEQVIRGYNPGHADRLADLREPYRNLTVVREAAKGRPGGEFDPKDLFRASESKLTKEKRLGARAAGEGPLQTEAERAMRTYDFPGGGEESNVFQLQALGGSLASVAPGIGGASAGGLMAPVGAAVTGALLTPTTLALTRGGTRFLSNEARWQRYLQDLLQREGMQELSRAARIGGAQYATE